MTSRWHPSCPPQSVRELKTIRLDSLSLRPQISLLARPPKGIFSARCHRKENRRRDTLLLLPCQGRMSSTATWQLAQRRPRMHNCVAHQLHTTHCRRRPSILISARSGCGRRGTTGRVGKKTISAWEGFLGQGTRGKRTKRTDCGRSGGRKNKDKR